MIIGFFFVYLRHETEDTSFGGVAGDDSDGPVGNRQQARMDDTARTTDLPAGRLCV